MWVFFKEINVFNGFYATDIITTFLLIITIELGGDAMETFTRKKSVCLIFPPFGKMFLALYFLSNFVKNTHPYKNKPYALFPLPPVVHLPVVLPYNKDEILVI